MDCMRRMTLKQFGDIVARVMEKLPDSIKVHCDNVVVDVEEEPDHRTLHRAGFTEEEIAEGQTLLGWFDPLELPTTWSGDAVNVNDMLHRLVIFKRPLEKEFPERKRFLTEVRKTVIHELAHHFGWTDADLEKFDDNPDPFGKGPERKSTDS